MGVIFLDFAKAFDKVPHKRLIAKLQAHGVDGPVLRWTESWLHGRLQRVCLDGHSSRWASVLSGIPQGSVLGPLLFLIFVNDIDSNVRSLLLKFADDTKVFAKVNSFAERQQLQNDLITLCDWAETWHGTFKFGSSPSRILFACLEPTLQERCDPFRESPAPFHKVL